MKSEQVEGVAEKLVGKAQSAVGRLLGDSQLEAEGTGRQASGQLTKTYGDALDNVSTFVREKPVAALAIGAVAALVISRLFRR
ncbi:CsbD family protein [Pseudomonas viridiflava]|uniref:CsbD protein n=1 Tax=Pseudomonas viridiflava TaxID=33069 RepID=A0A3M5P2E7_PSEVI|nr:CsbD family protein [Pseudomonas viridiflava]MBA1229880.1 CsbD family protein [Pseudomonas viridiflava]RMT78116.1 CsbD protein [Pseudomonas viridiflava]